MRNHRCENKSVSVLLINFIRAYLLEQPESLWRRGIWRVQSAEGWAGMLSRGAKEQQQHLFAKLALKQKAHLIRAPSTILDIVCAVEIRTCDRCHSEQSASSKCSVLQRKTWHNKNSCRSAPGVGDQILCFDQIFLKLLVSYFHLPYKHSLMRGSRAAQVDGKMAIQSNLSRIHVWHSGSTAAQCSHIWSANGTRLTRIATLYRPPSRRLHGSARSTEGSPRTHGDWSERPWRTGRWHTPRIKKSRFIHR